MYIVKKRLQRTKEQFKRDNALGFPFHKSDQESPERAAFISSLINNKEFVPTYNQNYEKNKGSVRDIIKKFNAFDYFCIITFSVCASIFAFGISATYNQNQDSSVKNVKIMGKKIPVFCLIWATIGLLAGLSVGVVNQISLNRSNKEGDTENLFYRLSVRLFDLLHETYPDLDENLLKACNPEMSRVIKTLLIANMSDEDIQQIQEIATNIAKNLRKIPSKDENSILLSCNSDIKQAMSIIEHNMLTNQLLSEAVLGVYRGNIPLKFSLQNTQKSRQ